jgi:outer membrane lipoprotein LolB
LQTRVSNQIESNPSIWHGRLSIQVDASLDNPASKRQSFSAGFELTGTAANGELRLFSPLGNTAADIRWTHQSAALEARGEIRNYSNLDDLTQDLLGASVPVPALFAWVQGQDLNALGWQSDLSEFPQGKVSARRLTPLPKAQLRLVLEP